MKSNRYSLPLFATLFLALSPCAVNAGLILTQGESFNFEFNSISTTSPFTVDPLNYARIRLSGTGLETGDSLRFTAYEDFIGEEIIQSTIWTNRFNTQPNIFLVGTGFQTDVTNAPWQDLAGGFRVEVISGTVELDYFKASTVIGSQHYEQTYIIPEPNSVALLLLGTGVLYLRRKRSSNKRVELTRKTLVDFDLS